jgi:6-phosphofructokinase 1
MSKERIGVLTSGGDCPGLNAVLRAVARAAHHLHWEVIGFKDGFEGMLPPGDFIILDRVNTAGIMHLGGTMLGTTNRGHFVAKVGEGNVVQVDPAVVARAKSTFDELGLKGLIVIGGDGSMSTALQLQRAGIPVVGVPKTIDNDLEATAMTFGFDSAVAAVADALDRLHTTASSHKRVMVLEVMGRHAGWIALHGGLAGGADVILIPEIPYDVNKVIEVIKQRDSDGAKSTMIVIAEGAAPKDGQQFRHAVASGEYRLGGVADQLAREISQRVDKEVRTCILGHLQRGGAPTTLDRILGTRFGVKAVQLIAEGKFGYMVSYQNYLTEEVPIEQAVHRLRLVCPSSQMVETARAVEISFGD